MGRCGEHGESKAEERRQVQRCIRDSRWGIRVNTISAGPLGSRAAKAIGFIDDMINYSMSNAPLAEKPLTAMEVRV